MTKGHLDQEAQHLQTIKIQDTNQYFQSIRKNISQLKTNKLANSSFKIFLENFIQEDAFPKSLTLNAKSNHVIYSVIKCTPKEMGYIDLTGCFPYH